jgi:hypothetical protein
MVSVLIIENVGGWVTMYSKLSIILCYEVWFWSTLSTISWSLVSLCVFIYLFSHLCLQL